MKSAARGLALALLVARVFADHHDHTVTADHLALIADRLNARLDLHRIPFDCNLITGEIRGSLTYVGELFIPLNTI